MLQISNKNRQSDKIGISGIAESDKTLATQSPKRILPKCFPPKA
nr:MAG TPA: hypothetical protein [Caudoviricetes sp.]